MARGFESKGAEEQRHEEWRVGPRDAALEAPEVARTRRTLELARSDVQARLRAARSEAQRESLRRALAALEQQLAALAGARG